MPQHRDDSKAGFPKGRTGVDAGAANSRVSRVPDDQAGTWGRPEGHGLSPVPDDADLPAEERTFSQAGGSSTQPAGTKRLATDEREDAGHLGREDFRADPDSSERSRDRLAKESGAD